jgi:hypothetical protein
MGSARQERLAPAPPTGIERGLVDDAVAEEDCA